MIANQLYVKETTQLKTASRSSIIARHSLLAYFILAYAISWSIEIPLGLSMRGIIQIQIPQAIHYLASFGPLLAALIVCLTTQGMTGAGRLFSGLTRWRVERSYLVFAILSPLVVFAAAVLISRLLQGVWPDLSSLGQVDYLPPIGVLPAVGLWLLTYGFGEEMGWRGFALPRLQENRSAFSASIILGVLWAGWHLPAFFYRDTYVAMGVLVVFQLLSVTAASIIMTWLYNGTRGSLLMIVIFHGLFDFLAVSTAGGAYAAIIMSAMMVFWAVRVLNVYGKENLAPVTRISNS